MIRSLSEHFWSASLEAVKQGYLDTPDRKHYLCLLCGHTVEKGVIYPVEDRWLDAEYCMRDHIRREHGSVFDYLVKMDKRHHGLTEHQQHLLTLFRQGLSDHEIVDRLGGGSSSTIRNHRFNLRERQKEAKVFLVIMELLSDGYIPIPTMPGIEVGNPPIGRRNGLTITESEQRKLIQSYFKQGPEGPLARFPKTMKHRLAILRHIVHHFIPDQIYTEKQISEILETIYPDFATLRRYLIDFGLMKRTADGTQYWLNSQPLHGEIMNHRHDLKQQYKLTPKAMGVYCIRNLVNGKRLVAVSRDLDKAYNPHQFQLKYGVHKNPTLQAEWNQYGEEKFVYEILEQLPAEEIPRSDPSIELNRMEKEWLEKLQPYDEEGYNQRKKDNH